MAEVHSSIFTGGNVLLLIFLISRSKITDTNIDNFVKKIQLHQEFPIVSLKIPKSR